MKFLAISVITFSGRKNSLSRETAFRFLYVALHEILMRALWGEGYEVSL